MKRPPPSAEHAHQDQPDRPTPARRNRRPVQFSLLSLLLAVCVLGWFFGWLLSRARYTQAFLEGGGNRISLPTAELAGRAENLRFSYQMSPRIRVTVRGHRWRDLPSTRDDPSAPEYVDFIITITGEVPVSFTGPARVPYTRAEFIRRLEEETNRALGIAEGARVVDLALDDPLTGR